LPSRKTRVIEALFSARWDPVTASLGSSVVTLDEVADAIRANNAAHPKEWLNEKNTANFFKDFVRRKKSSNENWPRSVLARGYTGRQITGAGACFEFVSLAPGQRFPFPGIVPDPTDDTPRHRIESASLPLASRRLGRRDEPWLVQVVVRLRVIETHLALYSQWQVVQVDHLQMSVKLGRTEIDALFLAIVNGPDPSREIIVTCEAKGRNDDILEDQVLSQAQAVFTMPGVTQDIVIPMAVKAVGASALYLVEFGAVKRDDAPSIESLSLASSAVYEFVPPVPGIGM